jgi:hypothetical protein
VNGNTTKLPFFQKACPVFRIPSKKVVLKNKAGLPAYNVFGIQRIPALFLPIVIQWNKANVLTVAGAAEQLENSIFLFPIKHRG